MGVGKWGQQDLSGSVYEWALDWYDTPCSGGVAGCNDHANLQSGSYRVMRGGFHGDDGSYLGAAVRDRTTPTNHLYSVGLRCARDGSALDLDPQLRPAAASGMPCSQVGTLDGCDLGQVCRFLDAAEGRCEEIGPALAGQPCVRGSDCDDQSVCYGGVCSAMCAIGGGDCVCPYGQPTCSVGGPSQFGSCLSVGYDTRHPEGFEHGVCSP